MTNYREQAKWKRKVRVKVAGDLGTVWPEMVQLIVKHLIKHCEDRGFIWKKFKFNMTPMSLNHMYLKNKSFKGQKMQFRLHPAVEQLRLHVMESMGEARWEWKPTGVTAAVILYESPYWITKKREIREMDVDNKIKPTLDAVQNATDIPDELHWQLHVFKLPSKWERTTVFLFDLGDVVEFYS